MSILHRLVIETLLEATDLPKPMYVHDVAELVAGLSGLAGLVAGLLSWLVGLVDPRVGLVDPKVGLMELMLL